MFQWEIKRPYNQSKGSSSMEQSNLKIKSSCMTYFGHLDEVSWSRKVWHTGNLTF